MPKVTKEYVETKKIEIINAAKTIFEQKPLYEMNMTDIIKEAGLSKGGIYRYFNDIDEIIIELINRESEKCSYKNQIIDIINNSLTTENKIAELFKLLGSHIDENVKTLGKMQFELTILQANYPEKAKRIFNGLVEYEGGKYLIDELHNVIKGLAKERDIDIKIKVEDIFDYIKIYVEGIIKIAVFERCYEKKEDFMNIKNMMDMLSKTVINMINE